MDAEKSEGPYVAGGDGKWRSHLEKVWQLLKNLNIVIQKSQKFLSIYPSMYVCIYIYIYIYISPYNNLYSHVHSSIIHNSQKVETTQTSIILWITSGISSDVSFHPKRKISTADACETTDKT